MNQHPALQAGRSAVITGGADGIGLAVARRLAGLGLNVLIADINSDALAGAGEQIRAAANGGARVETAQLDVADFAAVSGLKDRALADLGDIALVMNNAAIGGVGGAYENLDGWRRLLDVNLMGVLNGVQAFAPALIAQAKPALIVNTGSKQGITSPPGDTAYNVSKAGVKALTEGLQHSLRNTVGCEVSAHLLAPGSTFTGMTRRGRTEKPAGAWTPEQVADFMLERLAAGDFYILCPDNDVTRAMDNARMAWAMGDLIENRPALSRWHPDYSQAFADFLAARTADHG